MKATSSDMLVRMTTYLKLGHRHLDVACDLDVAGIGTRVAEWKELIDRSGLGAEGISGGARIWFSTEATVVVQDIVEREAQCCGFLDFEIGADGDRVRLDITSPVPEGVRVVAFLVGLDDGIGERRC